jgi:hypothetical protein
MRAQAEKPDAALVESDLITIHIFQIKQLCVCVCVYTITSAISNIYREQQFNQ